MDEKKELFKARINKTDRAVLARELIDAIDVGENALMMLLLGTDKPEEYAAHGKYQEGAHNYCDGLVKDTFTEKRLCKCLYYRNRTQYPKECEKCDFPDRYDIAGSYQITDYEVPAYYYGEGIGEIDLIISDGQKSYATEVKPYKGNKETLLKMIAEIMTYTIGYPMGKYEKAIAFFEGTKQHDEFLNLIPELEELIQKAGITVFCFKQEAAGKYSICKL